MRRERITYIGAYRHVMNRGCAGNDIFAGNTHKSHFRDYLEEGRSPVSLKFDFDAALFPLVFILIFPGIMVY
jgi:hypothetical protein